MAGLRLTMIACLFSLFAVPVHAAFEPTGTGARGVALGDNYAAMGDDILSLMYNPAELARVQQKELSTEYSRLYTGLSDGSNLSQYFLGYGQPVQWGGTLAMGIKQFSLDNLYKERTISLGYGEWLTSDIAIGGALKQLYHSFGVPNMIVDDNGNIQSGTPSFFAQNGNSNTAYSADLGGLYHWSNRSTLGLSVQDVNQPNIALNPADHEVVARTIRVANSYETDRHLTLGLGLMNHKSLASQTDNTFTGSAEKWWTLSDGDAVSVRGSLATGSREFEQGVLGAGYRFNQFQIDYAFVFNLTGITPGDTMGTHRFSLTYRFGPVGIPAKSKAPQKPKARRQTSLPPECYEPPAHEEPQPQTAPVQGKPRTADVTITPEGTDQTLPTQPLPRAAEITITPEDIDHDQPAQSGKAADVSIELIFDSDFDGVPDDIDECPNTPPGLPVDARGCAESQLDHHGNPLPHKAQVQFMPLEIRPNGH
jgi:hypothetical protein